MDGLRFRFTELGGERPSLGIGELSSVFLNFPSKRFAKKQE